ncbi:MAG TPA: OmpH family outer membrane protein [Saprospiraceae bacterium]|nr:OmpH family outer membrane protein [Saprospiraceae bacterium]HND89931.1 OmpH family outer membrane protein [Saprospiraceae bacterium]HNG89110.1 OmpH family outer membrane protein [Saprospiraceae bacterium]
MKNNISLILNIILLAAVAHLYYLNLKKSSPASPAIVAPSSQQMGARIAFVESDTLNEKYEWLKQQSEAIEQRIKSAENSLATKQQSLMKDASALEERARGGNLTQADYEKQMAALQQRSEKIRDEEARLTKSLADEQKKAYDELYAKVEAKLKMLSDQIGYDYILSYKRGGPILLASDSLDITKQVLDLLNAESKQ